MTVFEYASGLISIVIGLAVARVLGGISNFIAAERRIGSDWIVASWCFALLITLVGWWLVGWYVLRGQAEIGRRSVVEIAIALVTIGGRHPIEHRQQIRRGSAGPGLLHPRDIGSDR